MDYARPHRYRGHPLRYRRPTTYDPPFEISQPLERYRLHYGMRLVPFADFLGITERQYLRLIVDDREVPTVIKHQVARRLRVPPWMINECIPPLSEEELASVADSLTVSGEHGYYTVDPETGKATGEVVFDDEDGEPLPGQDIPFEHVRLASVYYKLTRVHRHSDDADYLNLREHVEQKIRQMAGLSAGEPFNFIAWAREGMGIPSWYVEPDDSPPS